jgi:hypothetical protein
LNEILNIIREDFEDYLGAEESEYDLSSGDESTSSCPMHLVTVK